MATYLCQFVVMADMPATMAQADMEGHIAQGLARYLQDMNLPANVSVQLVATAGNQTLAHHTNPFKLPNVPLKGKPI